ncbi:MAG: heavy metal translocating P-type ATPase metal-binding domain-containing protein [Bdellovibrionota bacterium]
MVASPANNIEINQCLHCDLPVPTERGEDSFCCSGCSFVYKTIHDNGLENFYDYKQNLGENLAKPAPDQNKNYLFFDSQEYQDKYVINKGSKTSKTTLFLDGIHCAACVWLLEKLPQILDQVIDARINFREQTLRIEYNSNKIKLSHIASTINSLGYQPSPPDIDKDEILIKTRRDELLRIGIAGLCAGNTMLLAVSLYQGSYSGITEDYQNFLQWISFLISIPAVFISAKPFFRVAINGLKAKMIHIDLPIAIGILAGFLISTWNTLTQGSHVYFDSICMLIFLLLIGRWFQNRGIDKARHEAALLPTVLPHEVNLVTESGVISQYIESIKIDDQIQVSDQQIIPIDGIISDGSASVSLAFLTGEASPIRASKGDKVFAGSKVLSGKIHIKTLLLGEQTRLGKILKLVTATHDIRPRINQLTDKLSVWFTSLVLTGATGCFLYWYTVSLDVAFQNTLAFLVVACPCALGLSAPTALSVAIARAANKGIFIKGEDVIERLSNTNTFVFDKTGTLTNSEILLKDVKILEGVNQNEVLSVIKSLEEISNHPIALAVKRKLRDTEKSILTDINEHPGKGISGRTNDDDWKLDLIIG